MVNSTSYDCHDFTNQSQCHASLPMQLPPSDYQSQFFQLIAELSDRANLCEALAKRLVNLAGVDACAIATAQGEILGSWWGKEENLIASDPTEIEIDLSKTEPQLLIKGVALNSLAQASANSLIILGKRQTDGWSKQEPILQSLASGVAVAIELQQQQQQLQTNQRHRQLLDRLSGSFSRMADLDLLLESVIEATANTLNIDGGSIMMLKYKNPLQPYQDSLETIKVETLATWPVESDSPLPGNFVLAQTPLLQAALDSVPQPLATSARQLLSTTLKENQTKSWLCAPLIGTLQAKNSTPLVLGFLVLYTDQTRSWNTAEIELMGPIAAQIRSAIIHDQTLHKVGSMVDNRTSQLTFSIDLQSRLQETMKQQIDQLKRINELKDDFLSSISHELKTPLTSMKMAIKMLRQPNLPDTLQIKYLDILEQEWNREYNLIKDLLTLQEVESGEIGFHPQRLRLNELVAQIAEQFETQWQPKTGISLEIDVADDLVLYTDVENLEQILSELLLNASKYADPHTTVTFEAERVFHHQTPKIVIAITNFGAGITPEEIPHIFEKFRRGKGVTDRAVPGTGLGLALVKSLVEYQDGTIEVTSEPTDYDSECYQTCFTLTLPQA